MNISCRVIAGRMLLFLFFCISIGCQLESVGNRPKLCTQRTRACPPSAGEVEVGGLVERPGVLKIDDDGLNLRQVVLRAGGVRRDLRNVPLTDLFVAVGEARKISSTTSFYALPLVESGVAGAVRVGNGDSVSIVERSRLSLDRNATANLVALRQNGQPFRLSGFVANPGTFEISSGQAEKLETIGDLKEKVALETKKSPADVVVITRQNPLSGATDRFVLPLIEIESARPQTPLQTSTPVNTPIDRPTPQANGLTELPDGGFEEIPFTGPFGDPGPNSERPSDPAGLEIVNRELASAREMISAASASPSRPTNSQQIPEPLSPTAISQRIPKDPHILAGDDIQFHRLALLPDVITGILEPQISAQAEASVNRVRELRERRRQARDERKKTIVGRASLAVDQWRNGLHTLY